MPLRLRPGTLCACGERMQPHPGDPNILTCSHCDEACPDEDCIQCRMYNRGSGKKLLAHWDPLVHYYAS